MMPKAVCKTVANTMKGIILCADDFAFNTSVSIGIVRLAQHQRISATSVMVLSPFWSRDVALLQGLRGHIDVGLHLDWTSDFALAAGHGLSLGAAMRRALRCGFDDQQARSQIARQLDLFETHWQAAPDYVDGHQHVHQFAGIREALVHELMRRYGHLPIQPYLRLSRSGTTDFKAWVIAKMGANALDLIASNACLSRAGALFGIYNFSGDTARYATLMTRWLAQSSHGDILMCHPSEAAEPGDALGTARSQEFAYLLGSGFAQALTQAHVQLVRGQEIFVERGCDSQ
jgi:predicted glycoside hydrolase/deacetylase ChbG (UPF0249 family)